MGEEGFIVPSWHEIDGMLNRLVDMVRKDSFRPDIIVGVSRGGLIPAAVLSDRLGVDCDAVRLRFYKSVRSTEETPKIIQHVSSDLSGKKVLIVDDVADTGHSLQTVKRYVQDEGAEDVMVCTLHYKPCSVIRPDRFVEETNAWIIYPWELNETVDDLAKKLMAKGLSRSEIKKEILRMGIPEKIIEEALP
jgi:hypoxanthine phosphoribosyltransferase